MFIAMLAQQQPFRQWSGLPTQGSGLPTPLMSGATSSGHAPPLLPLQGKVQEALAEGKTLTRLQRDDTFAQTECSASARGRDNSKQRFLTVSGPVAQLEAAYNLAKAAIADNLQRVVRGETLVTEEAAAAPADPQRIAAAKARHKNGTR